MGAEQTADKIKAKSAEAKDEAATGWQTMQDKWHSHVPIFTAKRVTDVLKGSLK